MPVTGWWIYTVILDKARVADKLGTPKSKARYYNHLVNFLLGHIDFTQIDGVNLIIDKCKNNTELNEFNKAIEKHLTFHSPYAKAIEGACYRLTRRKVSFQLPPQIPFYISHEVSNDNAGLQAVDLFCWGIFKKYEHNDATWYAVFKDKIVSEKIYSE